MKYFIGILLGALGAVLAFLPANVSANVNNFKISNYDINYTLSRDSSGASKLHTVERIEASFPFRNQNRGIERAIPTEFDGRRLPLTINSITNRNGSDYKYKELGQPWGGVKVLRIGDPKKYARGLHVYNIDYTQEYVTRYYADTDKDEWYWDTNGTGWKVPIEQLNVSVKIDDEILGALQSDPKCYIGLRGSNKSCNLVESAEGSYTVSATDLRAGENISIAFGFLPGTFAKYEPSLAERLLGVWYIATIVTSVLAIAVFIVLFVQYNRRNNRTDETKMFAVEYIPPRDASVTLASKVHSPIGMKSVFSAQLLDLAVRRYIQIVETQKKKLMLVADYDIVITKDLSTLRAEEVELLNDIFGKYPAVSDRVSMSSLRDDRKYFKRLSDNSKKLYKLIKGEYEVRAESPSDSRYFRQWFKWLLAVGLVTLSPLLLLAAAIAAIMGSGISPLTDKGVDLKRYILGFEKYIKAAESERLAFLQGPDTAEKVGEPVDVNDKGQVLKLYERALPYAVLYGHEKEWTKRLGEYYRELDMEPGWYAGRTAFDAAVFGSVVSSFTSSTSSYSSVSSSSSSGGSSGGGFSGGGGGGGGGGGW